ncbi:MAG: ABC transporter permease [Phototrophicaceae bacterium]|jgi:osmoprotectant transport system permease protein
MNVWLKALRLPALLIVVWLATYLWVGSQELDSIERRTLNQTYLVNRTIEHLQITVVTALLVIVIAVPLGVILTRRFAKPFAPLVLAVINIGQAIPAIGLLILMALWFGIGFRVALFSLVVYSLLPVLRNTITGIEQVDAAIIEAGLGMGMSKQRVLLTLELPLAVPVILAGVRTALVIAVSVSTVATFVNAGGLGDIIINGIKLNRAPVLITGSVMLSSVALLIDWLGGVVEDLLRPQGV